MLQCEEEDTIIDTAKECSEAYTAIRKSWKPTVTNGKQGKTADDMHKKDTVCTVLEYKSVRVCTISCRL